MTAPVLDRPPAGTPPRVVEVHTCQRGGDCLRCFLDADAEFVRSQDL